MSQGMRTMSYWVCKVGSIWVDQVRISMDYWNGFPILIQFWFWVVRILFRVSVKRIERHCFAAVNLVPKLTTELVLIKKGSIWTNKASALRSIPPVITDSVGLTS